MMVGRLKKMYTDNDCDEAVCEDHISHIFWTKKYVS
jgi:hypothetical protein